MQTEHIKYPKIMALHKEECEWILEWEVYVQEKIDWANCSIWYDEWLCVWSRTQSIMIKWEIKNHFRGCCEYIKNHEWINNLLKDNPSFRLYWERLVSHTIIYPADKMNKFYLFDILVDWEFIDIDTVYQYANTYWILTPALLHKGEVDKVKLKWLLDMQPMWVPWEWVVVKNFNFINKFYDKQYAKLVRPDFKESNNIVFGNFEKNNIEDEFAAKFINEARVLKIVNKIEQQQDAKITIEKTPMVLWLIYHDVFTEELWSFCWNKTINFWMLKKNCDKRARHLFLTLLNNGW